MEAKTKDLWVFVETKEDGSAKNVGIELLNPGRELANQQGGKLVAVIVGNTWTQQSTRRAPQAPTRSSQSRARSMPITPPTHTSPPWRTSSRSTARPPC